MPYLRLYRCLFHLTNNPKFKIKVSVYFNQSACQIIELPLSPHLSNVDLGGASKNFNNFSKTTVWESRPLPAVIGLRRWVSRQDLNFFIKLSFPFFFYFSHFSYSQTSNTINAEKRETVRYLLPLCPYLNNYCILLISVTADFSSYHWMRLLGTSITLLPSEEVRQHITEKNAKKKKEQS